jgi:hypothetical protein
MKNFVVFLLVAIVAFSCSTEELENFEGNESINNYSCIKDIDNKSVTKSDVRKNIYSKWKLTGMITMLPTVKVPNIVVQFKDVLGAPIDKQLADIYKDDVLLGSVLYSLEEKNFGGLTYTCFKPDSTKIGTTNEYNIIRGNIRICEDELMIDHGIVNDGPGYLFRKL